MKWLCDSAGMKNEKDTTIKLDSIEQGQSLTLTSALQQLQGALLSQGDKRSSDTVGAAIERIQKLETELTAMTEKWANEFAQRGHETAKLERALRYALAAIGQCERRT
jgi:hypothetical protein